MECQSNRHTHHLLFNKMMVNRLRYSSAPFAQTSLFILSNCAENGADADFSTKAVAEAIREAGGAVAADTGGINHLLEARRGFIVAEEDGVGVVGAVAIDVVDGFFDIGDH